MSMMEQGPFLLDISEAAFFGVLAYIAFYGLTLLAGGFLLLLLVHRKRRAKPMGAVVGWLTVVCLAGVLGEALWFHVHPFTAHPDGKTGPTYWRHLTVLGLGLTMYLLFRLNQLMLDKKN